MKIDTDINKIRKELTDYEGWEYRYGKARALCREVVRNAAIGSAHCDSMIEYLQNVSEVCQEATASLQHEPWLQGEWWLQAALSRKIAARYSQAEVKKVNVEMCLFSLNQARSLEHLESMEHLISIYSTGQSMIDDYPDTEKLDELREEVRALVRKVRLFYEEVIIDTFLKKYGFKRSGLKDYWVMDLVDGKAAWFKIKHRKYNSTLAIDFTWGTVAFPENESFHTISNWIALPMSVMPINFMCHLGTVEYNKYLNYAPKRGIKSVGVDIERWSQRKERADLIIQQLENTVMPSYEKWQENHTN